MAALRIDFVGDVVCPWCALGWRRLKSALARRPDVEAEVVWRPFQLRPDTPEDGVDYKQHLAAIFPDPERLRQVQARLTALAAAEGLELRLDDIARSPNTRAAHVLILAAQESGLADPAAEAVMRAYFTEGRDIGRREVLADIGEAVGLDRGAVLDRLASPEAAEEVERAVRAAQAAGVQGVPFMVFGERYAVSGAEELPALLQAVDMALSAQA